jgi:hypothetical protein
LFSSQGARRFLFRTISQTAIQYRGSAISSGIAGRVWGGDRLPWVKADDGADNFAPLRSLDWQVHVYGEVKAEMETLSRERRLALHVFPYNAATQRAGLRRNAAYLVRPDGHVALAAPEGFADKIAAFLDAWSPYPLHATAAL